MSLLSPTEYIARLKGKSYRELIAERRSLLEKINQFERDERTGKRRARDIYVSPSPSVRYQNDLQCLAALCAYMQEKYNTDFVWGGNTLRETPCDEEE